MSEVEGYCVCDGASTPVLDCGVSAHRAKAHELRAGSSVPEAARAAAFGQNWAVKSLVDRISVALMQAWEKAEPDHMVSNYPASFVATFVDMARAVEPLVAAASVELQQEVDRLSAECEALRGTVAEERATTGRRIEAAHRVTLQWQERALAAERKVRAVETVTCWTNEDGKRFMFVDDVAAALEVPGSRAALASPGEGE